MLPLTSSSSSSNKLKLESSKRPTLPKTGSGSFLETESLARGFITRPLKELFELLLLVLNGGSVNGMSDLGKYARYADFFRSTMGIKQLFKFIHENAPRAVKEAKMETYAGRVLAVDASMCLYQVGIQYKDVRRLYIIVSRCCPCCRESAHESY